MATSTAAQARRTRSIPRPGPALTAVAILMPIGPLAIAVVRAILPYNTTDSNTAMAAKVAAHQGTEMIVIWLTLVALLTLIPGVIALGMLARRHAPKLGTAGLVLAYAAFACLFWSSVASSDTVALGAARIGMHPGTTGALLTSIANIPPVGLGTAIFVFGHIISLVLLHSSTFAGSPLAAAAVTATIGAIKSEGLLERTRELGPRVRDLATAAVTAHCPHLVSEVRGEGLLIGVDFVSAEAATEFLIGLLDEHVIPSYSLNAGNVLRLTPPAILDAADLDWLGRALTSAARHISRVMPIAS